jgi:ubiquinone/menaquinone biosynthesis C-methylase UbiE
MGNRMRQIDYWFMACSFKIRDFFTPPRIFLEEAGIESGFYIVDYGCGPGSYSIEAAIKTGKSGKVYAFDIDSLAIKNVLKTAQKKGLKNITAIETDCFLELPDESIDIVLLYDTFHDLRNPAAVLKELHRVLKPKSFLSFSDHHLKEEEILQRVKETALFKFQQKGRKTYRFVKA